MKVALYTRVSTNEQSVDMQLSDLRRYCEQQGFKIYKEFCDEGISGLKDRRPALDELMEDARKRKFDAVLCWRFDRFARSTKHLITALEEFRHLNIDLSLTRKILTPPVHWVKLFSPLSQPFRN